MVNQFRLIVACGMTLFITGIATADETRFSGTDSLSGLDLFDDTYGPSDSRCGLGFVAYGSPVVVTRVSGMLRDDWVTEADQLVKINGAPIHRKFDMHSVLDAVSPNEEISVTVLRNGVQVKVKRRCQVSTPILEARQEALVGASEGRWDVCISATIMEEIRWGGANSQTAGLRLWCHQARIHRSRGIKNDPATISRLHAQLIYDYATLLLDELRHVPDSLDEFKSSLKTHIQFLDENSTLRSQVTKDSEVASVTPY